MEIINKKEVSVNLKPKKKIFIIAGYFYPGFKSGGPVQSLINMIEKLEKLYEFHVLANDRDLGDKKAYYNITTDEWVIYKSSFVFYTNFSKLTASKMYKLISNLNPETIYINNIYEYKVLYLIMTKKLIRGKKIIVAPRGTLAEGAIRFKYFKKSIYLKALSIIDFNNQIIFHSTSLLESKQIQQYFKNNRIILAENIAQMKKSNVIETKRSGELKLIFASRIHPTKNLLYVLNLLKKVKKKTKLDIFGYIEDKKYWEVCQKQILQLNHIHLIQYHGFKPKDELAEEFSKSDLFIFPTMGENFGHIIFEALSSGCPVITSDQTSWKTLEGNRGLRTIPIAEESRYIKNINEFIELSKLEHFEIKKEAQNYIKDKYKLENVINHYTKLFCNR